MDRKEINSELAALVTNKTFAIYDFEFIKALKRMPWGQWFDQEKTFRIRPKYLEEINNWIHSSQLNTVKGLERFTARDLINGTTQTFDESYQRYAQKRLRFFRGEYAYHRRTFANWKFVEDGDLEKNDFVVISNPFCSTGATHPRYNELLEVCDRLEIPVLVDCAYFGTCTGIQIDVSAKCIESVSFSLSKGIGLGDIRSGIRYSDFDDFFPISHQNKYEHTVLAAAKIGLYMMGEFSPDFIPLKYREAQLSICSDLNIEPSPCMHLATSKDDFWQAYNIDERYFRLGIRDLVKQRRYNRN